ncbi:hypothetical protein HF283_07140 [Acidithiobacillus ferrooxidans]|nr:hypothetical protein [Acidithiobacillus ferrooxidans]
MLLLKQGNLMVWAGGAAPPAAADMQADFHVFLVLALVGGYDLGQLLAIGCQAVPFLLQGTAKGLIETVCERNSPCPPGPV